MDILHKLYETTLNNYKYYFIHYEWCDYCIFNFNDNTIKREYYSNEIGKFKFENNLLIINWNNWIGDDTFILSFKNNL